MGVGVYGSVYMWVCMGVCICGCMSYSLNLDIVSPATINQD